MSIIKFSSQVLVGFSFHETRVITLAVEQASHVVDADQKGIRELGSHRRAHSSLI